MTARILREHAEQVALVFATQIYQRYLYDDLSDAMANEFTLYGSLLSLGRLSSQPAADSIRESYTELESSFVDGYMGPADYTVPADNTVPADYTGPVVEAINPDYFVVQAEAVEYILNNLNEPGWV
jgi:hypothetical protein